MHCLLKFGIGLLYLKCIGKNNAKLTSAIFMCSHKFNNLYINSSRNKKSGGQKKPPPLISWTPINLPTSSYRNAN